MASVLSAGYSLMPPEKTFPWSSSQAVARFLLSCASIPSMSWSRVYFQHYLQVKIHPLGRLSPLEPPSSSTNVHQSHRGWLALGVMQDTPMTQRRLPVPFGQGCCWLDEEVGLGGIGTSSCRDATTEWGHAKQQSSGLVENEAAEEQRPKHQRWGKQWKN